MYYARESAFKAFFDGTLEEKFAFIDKLVKEEDGIADTLEFWLIYSHRLLVAKYLPSEHAISSAAGGKSDQNFKTARLTRLDSARLVKFIGNLSSILNLINNSNVNRRLALENLALEIPAP